MGDLKRHLSKNGCDKITAKKHLGNKKWCSEYNLYNSIVLSLYFESNVGILNLVQTRNGKCKLI